MNPGENPQRARLLGALLAADETLKRLRLDDRRRGELARRIRAIESALDALEEM
jgi:hypothetical protein